MNNKQRSRFSTLVILISMAVSHAAFAEDDASDAQKVKPPEEVELGIEPEAAFERTQAVLRNFGVPSESDSQIFLNDFQNLQTSEGLHSLLPFFDPKGQFSKFSIISSTQLNAYQDLSGFQAQDFSVNLRSELDPLPISSLGARLHSAASNTSDAPLHGLRIALDPGHVGSDIWDVIMGKFVHDSFGRKLSEGVMNLQTARLLESQLTSLGAQVMITRQGLKPVTSIDFQTFDLHPHGLKVLREQSLYPWFQSLLAEYPVGPELYEAFSANKDYHELFSEFRRETYYNDADLQARTEEIEAFQPDLTIFIHYDTSAPASDPHGLDPGAAGHRDGTKVYLPGAFDPTEMASRADRVQLARMVLDETPWKASHALAREVASTMSSELKIPFDLGAPGNLIEPGIYTRNLFLLKNYRNSAIAYVECLFYNDKGEFEAFYDANHPMTIDGQNFPYSDRMVHVATALQHAVVQFVKKGF